MFFDKIKKNKKDLEKIERIVTSILILALTGFAISVWIYHFINAFF